jgi:hypothetical protein
MDFKKFVHWRKTWTNYTTVIKLPDQTREQQITTFRSFCSPELLIKMIHAMKIAEDTAQTLEQILTTVEIYLKERRNVALDRLRLVNQKQQEGEVFEDFYVALCVAALDADLQGMDYKAWMATLLTVGITDYETRQKLLAKTPSPTMDETLTLCRNEEKGLLGQGDLRDPKAMVAETKFVPRKFSKFTGNQGRSRSPSHSREHSDKCKYYGYSHGKGECRAKGQKCNKCNKMNHFARCCRERDCQGQNAVIIAACREDKEPSVPLNLTNFLTCAFAILDTGAQGSVADSKLLDDLDMDLCDLDKPKHKEIVGIDGSDLHPVASLTVDHCSPAGDNGDDHVLHGCAQVLSIAESLQGAGHHPRGFSQPDPAFQEEADGSG